MSKPVLFLVHDDSSTLEALEADVRRRFAADYTVLTGASSEAATSALAELGSRGDEVALIVAPELDGVGGARLEAITLRVWHRTIGGSC